MGNVVGEFRAPLVIDDSPERCLRQGVEGIDRVIFSAGTSPSAVSGIAVGVPGPVILDAGRLLAPPIMPGWDGCPIRQRLADQLALDGPITVDNDADLGALGEWADKIASHAR